MVERQTNSARLIARLRTVTKNAGGDGEWLRILRCLGGSLVPAEKRHGIEYTSSEAWVQSGREDEPGEQFIHYDETFIEGVHFVKTQWNPLIYTLEIGAEVDGVVLEIQMRYALAQGIGSARLDIATRPGFHRSVVDLELEALIARIRWLTKVARNDGGEWQLNAKKMEEHIVSACGKRWAERDAPETAKWTQLLSVAIVKQCERKEEKMPQFAELLSALKARIQEAANNGHQYLEVATRRR